MEYRCVLLYLRQSTPKLLRLYEPNEEMLRQYCGKNADTAKRYKLLISRISEML